MATTNGIQRDRGKEEESETDIDISSVLPTILEKMNIIGNKMDTTNDLLRELIQVCTVHSVNNNYEETFVKSVNVEENKMHYKSPSEIIQHGINERVLQNEADGIKRQLKVEWSRTLNFRKQLFWKQINNANDAEQYEKWLAEDIPILPRKFRITEINGEPEDQKNIRANLAIDRVKGEIQLLRMRSERSQEKLINLDEQMIQELKKKASGEILQILQNMWKSDCEKEEKRSQERWRIKEIWQLDYVRKYGNNIMKEQNQRKPKRKPAIKPTTNGDTFANAVRQSFQQNSYHTFTNNVNNQRRNTSSFRPQGRAPVHNSTSTIRGSNHTRSQNQECYNYPHKKYGNQQQGTILRKNGTTFIGKRVNTYFLGGGKSSGGERFQHQ